MNFPNSKNSENSNFQGFDFEGEPDFSDDEKPIPLFKKDLPAKPFPLEPLGDLLGGAVNSLQRVVQAPDGICVQSVLAAANCAVQGYRNIEIAGRIIPLSMFFVSIAESGERKSSADRLVLLEQKKFEQEKMKVFTDKYDKYLHDKRIYEASENAAKRTKRHAAFIAENKPPLPPTTPLLFCSDPTFEGLIKHLALGLPVVGIFSDEGGRILGGTGFQTENLLKSAASFSSLWDGGSIDRVRSGDGTTKIYGRRADMHLMIQPIVLKEIVKNPILRDQGLLARCLLSYPNSTSGSRFYKDEDLTLDACMLRFWQTIRRIIETDLPQHPSSTMGLEPPNLHLSEDAKAEYIAFHDETERQIGQRGSYAQIKGFSCKAGEHALRIAGTIHSIESFDELTIQVSTMKRAIEITRYYLDETLRIFSLESVPEEIELAEQLFNWMKEFSKQVNRHTLFSSEILQRSPNRCREKKTANKLLKILTDHKYLLKLSDLEIDGKVRKDCWTLNPDA